MVKWGGLLAEGTWSVFRVLEVLSGVICKGGWVLTVHRGSGGTVRVKWDDSMEEGWS